MPQATGLAMSLFNCATSRIQNKLSKVLGTSFTNVHMGGILHMEVLGAPLFHVISHFALSVVYELADS